MRQFSFPAFLILVAFLAIPLSAVHAGGGPFAERRVVLYGTGAAGPYPVGFRFLGGAAAPDTSAFNPSGMRVIAWDAVSGTLTFDRAIPAGDSIAVILAVPPSWLSGSYTRQETARDSEGQGLAIDYREYGEKVPKAFPGLSFGGSKTFDVNVGAGQEVALNQSLRLNISGKLTDDITLNAIISDQNVPISPEGNTRDLEELDRVLIELRGTHFRADMGDTDLRREGGRWLSWSRRLSGANVAVSAKGVSAFASGAVSEGRRMSTTLTPVEGNQGPYRMIASNGNSDISIVPGTEKLWINGVALTRGESDDYTIDYTTGEVTFTARRIIGSDMRIVADYEYTSESYRRTFSSGGADGSFFGGKLKIGAVAAREADDDSRPVLTELDDITRSILAQSGDSLAVVSGIRSAEGDTTGTYDLVDGYLVYNPLGKGKYNVTFSWVGQDLGSYQYSGGGIYVFVPPEERVTGSGASYDPVGTIPAPVSHSIAGVELSAEPLPWMKIETEAAASSYDANTLSRLNDSDNGGGAYRLGLSISPTIRAFAPLRVDVSGNHRNRGRTFRPLDRDRDAEENRRWGLPLLLSDDRETVTEYSGGISLAEGGLAGTGIAVSGGRAEFGETSVSERAGMAGNLSFGERGAARLDMSRITRSGVSGTDDQEIGRFSSDMRVDLRGFIPSFAWEHERVEIGGTDSPGSGYDDYAVRLHTPKARGIQGEAEWFYRSELARHGAWTDSSLARGGSVGLTAGTGVRGMISTEYSRRERITGSARNVTDQARMEGYYHPGNNRVRFDGSYQAGRLREGSKRRNYIYIGSGKGQYRWEDENGDGVRDPDEFIPDEHGSYYVYEETLDDYTPVNTVHAFGKIGVDLFGTSGSDARFRSETTFEVNESSSADAADVFLLKLGSFRKKGVTTSGDARLQQDVTIPLVTKGSLRLRVFRRDSYNAEYVTGAERSGEEEQSLRLRQPLRESVDAELTLARSVWSRFMEDYDSGDFRVLSYNGDASVSLYPERASTVAMSLSCGYDRDRVSGIRATWWLIRPGYTYRISAQGKVEASYAYTSVRLSGGMTGVRLPYTMARGHMEGSNHDIQVTYDHRITTRMNLVTVYTGRMFAGRAFEHFAQVQVRAIF